MFLILEPLLLWLSVLEKLVVSDELLVLDELLVPGELVGYPNQLV